jgi:fibronectin type 3 domain-containing protein
VQSMTGTGTAAPVHTVQLSWGASTSQGVTSYNVYRAVFGTNSCGSYSTIGSTSSSITTYTDNVVTDGTTYCYATTAVDPNGESAYSNIAQATIPPL